MQRWCVALKLSSKLLITVGTDWELFWALFFMRPLLKDHNIHSCKENWMIIFLTHFIPLTSFCTPWKLQDISGFLIFLGLEVKTNQWHEIGLIYVIKNQTFACYLFISYKKIHCQKLWDVLKSHLYEIDVWNRILYWC